MQTIKMWNHQTNETQVIGHREVRTRKQAHEVREELIDLNRTATGCWLYYAE